MNNKEMSDIEKVKKLLKGTPNHNSLPNYDIIYENGHYFINEISSNDAKDIDFENKSEIAHLKENNVLTIKKKVGKSFQTRGWSLGKAVNSLFSENRKISFIEVDGLNANNFKLDVNPRLFYRDNNIQKYLKSLHDTNEDSEIEIKLYLEDIQPNLNLNNDNLISIDKKIGKSYKSLGWTLGESAKLLVTENKKICKIEIDGFEANDFNLDITIRLFYMDKNIQNYLKSIGIENPDRNIEIKIYLENSNINELDSFKEEDSQFSLKSKFAIHYKSIAPLNHRNWFSGNIEKKLDQLSSKYRDSFYHDLFEIDFDKLSKEIDLIQLNVYQRRVAMDKSFDNYVRMTGGIANEIITYYIDFLRNKEYEKEFCSKSNISNDYKLKNVNSINPVKKEEIDKDLDYYKFTIKNLKGWNKAVYDKISILNSETFKVRDLYVFIQDFQEMFPNNTGIEITISHTIKRLRGLGLIKVVSRGKYANKMYGHSVSTMKREKIDKNLDKINEVDINNNILSNESTICKFCGKSLPDNYPKNVCRNCSRKSYSVKILNILLRHFEPETEFSKENLESVGYESIQVNDYLWTLVEYGLVLIVNGKYKLKKKEILDKFIEENKYIVEDEDFETVPENERNNTVIEIKEDKKLIKLNKICSICGENLPILNFGMSNKNDDGLNEYCKKCFKIVSSVKYLNKLLSIINYYEYFTYGDIKTKYDDLEEFNHNIKFIQENDLLTEVNNGYILTDENKINEFLEKYSTFSYDNATAEKGDSERKITELEKKASENKFNGEPSIDLKEKILKYELKDKINKNSSENDSKQVKTIDFRIERLKSKEINDFIHKFCTKLELNFEVTHFANILYEYSLEKNFNTKWNTEIITCVCIYIASRKFNVHINLNEISDISSFEKSVLTKAYWLLYKDLNIEIPNSMLVENISIDSDKLDGMDNNLKDHGSDGENNINIKGIDKKIYKFSTELDLPLDVIDCANTIYKIVSKNHISINRDSHIVVSACIYIASRKFKNPRTLNEIANVSNSTKTQIGRAYRALNKELNIKLPLSSPLDYIPRFNEKLAFSDEVKSKAIKITEEIVNKGLNSGKDAAVVAGVVLYIASKSLGEGKNQREFANIIGSSDITIRKLNKEFDEKLDIKNS